MRDADADTTAGGIKEISMKRILDQNGQRLTTSELLLSYPPTPVLGSAEDHGLRHLALGDLRHRLALLHGLSATSKA